MPLDVVWGWSWLRLCPPGQSNIGSEKKSRPHFWNPPLPLNPSKPRCFPLFRVCWVTWCASLCTRVCTTCCDWSTSCPLPSDWWKMTCVSSPHTPPGELIFNYVYIAMYTSFFFVVWLAHKILIPFLSIRTQKKIISTNRPTKGIIDINQKLKKLLKVIIYEKERIIPFKVNAKKIVDYPVQQLIIKYIFLRVIII